MSKLNPNAQKWVDALRSGKYAQTTGSLRYGNGFCCLGVLCEEAIKAGLPVDVAEDSEDDGHVAYDGESGVLPNSVREWVGLSSAKGMLPPKDDYPRSLAAENDDGANFKQIANLIESYADELGVSA